ncbi:MAG: hypothetical protein J0I24_14540 [Thiomonas arsenitoxydans]|uniref:Uncharacterized protein n=1 Tax=Thiomonas arsenitoxydans (strain DSM 22701 / CIP 110005 / 3As) TaxID=426114 RepID=A0A8I1MXD4_THIA3|nr:MULTISPECIES: hypothetical protein [Thiomonas]MBN8745500.1 hypothetical protein [Thiomonas arsenitoxydans]ODU95902.1 MAG: hypothetical protein ABT24_10805 [Thiomonas sp. SCN 64-16]
MLRPVQLPQIFGRGAICGPVAGLRAVWHHSRSPQTDRRACGFLWLWRLAQQGKEKLKGKAGHGATLATIAA